MTPQDIQAAYHDINMHMESGDNFALADALMQYAEVIRSCLSDAGLKGYPIEIAPKDGTVILGYWGKGPGGIDLTKYWGSSWVSNEDVEIEYCEPVSWMPLDAISDALGKVYTNSNNGENNE